MVIGGCSSREGTEPQPSPESERCGVWCDVLVRKRHYFRLLSSRPHTRRNRRRVARIRCAGDVVYYLFAVSESRETLDAPRVGGMRFIFMKNFAVSCDRRLFWRMIHLWIVCLYMNALMYNVYGSTKLCFYNILWVFDWLNRINIDTLFRSFGNARLHHFEIIRWNFVAMLGIAVPLNGITSFKL